MEIAVIDPNTISAKGMKMMINEIMPEATVRTFPDFGALADDTPYAYSCYFVTSQVYVLYSRFFLPLKEKTVIMTYGHGNMSFPSSHKLLDLYDTEERIRRNLSQLLGNNGTDTQQSPYEYDLSPREIEVLVLVTKGLINKEIADKLNISLTTVISHRKNITEKLGIKSVSGLTIYAVMNGYVAPDGI